MTTPEHQPVHCIVAMTPEGLIGVGNAIPWRVPEDMAHFKQMTTGKAVIMGRKTWDSLPEKFRPLPNRYNIIVSRKDSHHEYCRTHRPEHGQWGCMLEPSVERAVTWARSLGFEPWIIGGGQIYAEALPYVTDIHMTVITREVTIPGCPDPGCLDGQVSVNGGEGLAHCQQCRKTYFPNIFKGFMLSEERPLGGLEDVIYKHWVRATPVRS